LDICLIRSVFGFMQALSQLWWRGESFNLDSKLLGRSFCAVIAYIGFVAAIARLPFGLISTIERTGPMSAAMVAVTFSKERVGLL